MSWSWWGAPGVLVIGLAWPLAVVALRAGPGRRLNRLLAWLLFLEGAYTASNLGLIFMVEAETAAKIVSGIGLFSQVALPLQYRLFLGEALRTPLTRPLPYTRKHVPIFIARLLRSAPAACKVA